MERLMTAKQVSELIEVKPSTVYQWVHLGLIPYVKLGKCVRFKKAELFRWIDKNFRKERISFRSVEKTLIKYSPSRQKEFFELE
ncbi:MAG: helix-turn-helix domain-containing protein [Candidatus Omnitrophota bacterium]